MSDEEDEDEGEKELNAQALSSKSELPDLFEGGTMRPYQIDGFRWLVVESSFF